MNIAITPRINRTGFGNNLSQAQEVPRFNFSKARLDEHISVSADDVSHSLKQESLQMQRHYALSELKQLCFDDPLLGELIKRKLAILGELRF